MKTHTTSAAPRARTGRYPLANIDRDQSIQCRAAVSNETVRSYADDMSDGAKFPPVDLYGTKDKAWIGDGWHRIEAGDSLEWKDIPAILHPGGRVDALKHALRANALHGQRRTNADKRKCVQIALQEFPKLADSAIGKLCGVDHKTVAIYRPKNLGNSQVEKRVGLDGKRRPAKLKRKLAPTTAAATAHNTEEDRPRVTTADQEMNTAHNATPEEFDKQVDEWLTGLLEQHGFAVADFRHARPAIAVWIEHGPKRWADSVTDAARFIQERYGK